MSEHVDDVTLAGDCKENVESKEIEEFMIINGLIDAFWHVNKEEEGEREKTHIRGECIYSIAVTNGLLHYLNGCEMMSFNEIIVTDYRGFLLDIDMRSHFKVQMSDYDDQTTVC